MLCTVGKACPLTSPHEHCSACGDSLALDNCDGPMYAGGQPLRGSTEGEPCSGCGEFFHDKPGCGNVKFRMCAPCIKWCKANKIPIHTCGPQCVECKIA